MNELHHNEVSESGDEDSGFNVARLLEEIFTDALTRGASAIEFCPAAREFGVWFRIDGSLARVKSLPRMIRNSVIGRIKGMAQMDVAERCVRQSGSLTLITDAVDVTCAVETVPEVHGERVIVRRLPHAGR